MLKELKRTHAYLVVNEIFTILLLFTFSIMLTYLVVRCTIFHLCCLR